MAAPEGGRGGRFEARRAPWALYTPPLSGPTGSRKEPWQPEGATKGDLCEQSGSGNGGRESGSSGFVGSGCPSARDPEPGCPHSHSSERLNHFKREVLRRVKVMNECRQGSGGG